MKWALIAFAATIAFAGCATINRANDYHGMGIEDGEVPLETIEIENTGWLLFRCIPLGSGDPLQPNRKTCRFFRNTVTLCGALFDVAKIGIIPEPCKHFGRKIFRVG